MARGINKVILIGNVGVDPDVRYMPNGNAVTTLSLATSETWKDKQTGEKKQATEWHKVVFYRELAQVAAKYLKKGDQVYIEGKIKTRKYTDQGGVERYITEVHATDLRMLGSKKEQGNTSNDNSANNTYFDDDVPF